jgi:hypothetical protein
MYWQAGQSGEAEKKSKKKGGNIQHKAIKQGFFSI